MSLHDIIAARIHQDGPISMADYMTECLLHPVHGYYVTRDPLGLTGDFVTAPEISQMFGELIGLAVAQTWLDQGAPDAFALAELGPGRGTLMADALRAAGQVPGFAAAARTVLVEASPVLRTIQRDTLAGHAVDWIETPEALPDLPLFVIANEFFDALPVRQFERAMTGWHEVRVGLEGDRLQRGLAGEAPQPALVHRLEDTKPGDLVEFCPQAERIAATLASRIAARGGAALIVDYGDWRSLGDTVQALRSHAPVDVFEAPGQADLTAHVDFESLALAARRAGCSFSRLTRQGVFLERLRITARAQSLASARPDQADAIAAAHRRLTHPEEMGNLFKVIAFQPETAKPPPGLMP